MLGLGPVAIVLTILVLAVVAFMSNKVPVGIVALGVALARVPLVADALAGGDLVEVMPDQRMDSPLSYWMIVGPRSGARPEVQAFCDWMREQAALTRAVLGEGTSAPATGAVG